MSDLGALLRKAREQRGYTLEDIQEATKIRKRYLEAIESGEYKVLPGSFYVRAFVKTYAETVGLDAEEVLRLYQRELPQSPAAEQTVSETLIKPKRRSVQHNDRWGKIAVSVLMWAFPVLIAVVIYVYWIQNREPEQNVLPQDPVTTDTSAPSTNAGATPTPILTPTPTTTPTPPKTVVTFDRKGRSVSYFNVSPAGEHTLEIKVSGGRPWIGVNKLKMNGEKVYEGTPKDGETLTFTFTEALYVNVGRADFCTILIDGVEVEDSNRSGSDKFLFTPVDAPQG